MPLRLFFEFALNMLYDHAFSLDLCQKDWGLSIPIAVLFSMPRGMIMSNLESALVEIKRQVLNAYLKLIVEAPRIVYKKA